MKKLFTLFALLTLFLGANAQGKWEKVYSIDYSTYSGFPFYVMGFVPEFGNGYMADFGANYGYKNDDEFAGGDFNEVGTVTTQAGVVYHKVLYAAPDWHQYFIADGIQTKIDGRYKVVAQVRATAACSINVNMGWGWNSGESMGASVSIPDGVDFQEVEWEYTGIGGSSCNLVAQPGTVTETIEWLNLTVYEFQREGQRPKVWQEWLTNDGNSIIPDVETTSKYVGDAEFGQWPEWALQTTDGINANWRGDRTGEICAWSLTMGRNFDDQNTVINEDSPRSRPYPADIEAEEGNESNHIFAVHVTEVKPIDSDESVAWANQFWIQSPKGWKSGTKAKIKFRYKAQVPCSVATQIHKKNPSDYLFYNAVGDINFTTEWQTFEKDFDFSAETNDGWSLAFNLNNDATNGRVPNVFYFDDLSWKTMVLDEGFFVSGINTATTTSYDDLDNAIQFEKLYPDDDEDFTYFAVVGEEGNKDSYVDQVMVSTTRGDDQAFKGATLKPQERITAEKWLSFVPATNAKLDLPGIGVWKVYIDTEYNALYFELVEGTPYDEPELVDIVTNPTEVTVKGQERNYTQAEAEELGITIEGEAGNTWDNQFFLVANRVLKAGEETVVKFKYKASVDGATSGTQSHAGPGQYIHYVAIGNLTFGNDWQDFEYAFTIPAECDGSDNANGYKNDFMSVAFNMAEIKGACDYQLKDFQWYLKSGEEGQTYENLIDATGAKNFWVKEGAGTNPYEFGTDPSGISTVKANAAKSTVIYNLAGQRVSKDYKGIVVNKDRKVVMK